MKRSVRRHHLKRMKRKASSLGDTYSKLYNHLANCSCWMCGNPRKHFKEQSVKERLNDDWNKLSEDWMEIWRGGDA